MEGVASKFACLQDDDSTDWVAPKEKGKKSKPANEPKPNSSKSKKKNKANNEAKELQNLAFASKKSKNKNKSKSQNADNKSSTKQEAQYEEWKQKDEKLVDDTFAQDVEKALLLSKLDFEEQKATKKILDEERLKLAILEAAKKPITMSLAKFQQTEPERNHDSNLPKPCDIQNQTDFVKSKPLVIDKKDTLLTNGNKKSHDNFEGSSENDNGQFFTNLQQDTLNLINHEKKQSTRNMSVTKNGVALNESALMKQFKDTVAIKDIEIAKLQSDNETLKSELMKIKNRYKGIRQILDQAELKEKVEILIEVEKLRKVRDEMSENISSLTKELEQSKTREHLLGDELRSLQAKHSGKTT